MNKINKNEVMPLEHVTGELGRHVRDAVVITEAEPIDLPGPRIVWVNQAFCDMTGYSREEAIGQTPRLLQGPDTDPQARARIREALQAWRPMREVLKNYTKDGEPFWVELDVKPIADAAGWHHYWVAVQRDVSEQMNHQAALREARDAAEAANRLKSEFLANMSHEIRTPLNGALGMAQVLALTDLDARQRRAVDTIISSGKSLLGLIEDVLDLSRIESGHLQLDSDTVTGRALITDAAEAVRGVTTAKGLTLSVQPGPGGDTVFHADGRRIRQVLINLAGNAAKFTAHGQVIVSCQASGDQMVFEVRDTGPGVEASQREVIFERFHQGDGSLARRHGGTGLGLSIARQIVQACGGAITVDDAAEGGAAFRVVLPMTPASAGAPAALKANPDPAPVADRGRASDRARRALVIEDNRVNQAVVRDCLALADWSVDCEDRAEPGLRAWRAGDYDLVIMDRQMPDMNGEEAIRRLRREEADHKERRRTPVLMLTAHALSGAEDAALDAGADAYLPKPVDLERLIAVASDLAARAIPR